MSNETKTQLLPGLRIHEVKPLDASTWYKKRLERIRRMMPDDIHKPSTISADDATAAIFPALDTRNGPGIAAAVRRAMFRFTTQAHPALSDHGGGMGELALTHPHRYNGPGIFRTFMQLEDNPLLAIPGATEVPEEEWLAREVAVRTAKRNQDLYAYTRPHNLPPAAGEIADSVESYLTSLGHRVKRTTTDGQHVLTTLWDPDLVNHRQTIIGVEKFPGIGRNRSAEITLVRKKIPTAIRFLIGIIHPQGNYDWPLASTQVETLDEHDDTLDFPATWFLNPEPTTKWLRHLDNRDGVVNRRQHMSSLYHPDGSIRMPAFSRVLNHQPRIPETLKEIKDLGSQAVEWTRMARYGSVFGVFADVWKHRKAVQFPDAMPGTLDDMRQLATSMADLARSGQTWSYDKDIELATDNTIAMHHQGDLFLRTLKHGIPPALHGTVIPNIRIGEIPTYLHRGSWVGDGNVFVVQPDGSYYFTSGLTDKIRGIRFDFEQYKREWPENNWRKPPELVLPNGSPLAVFLWWTKFFPTMKRS